MFVVSSSVRMLSDEFNRAKGQLIAASDQNYFSGFNDLMNGALATATLGTGNGGGTMSRSGRYIPTGSNPNASYNYNPNNQAYA
jgi:hypothetical protein